jgi:micrococcal nuclease
VRSLLALASAQKIAATAVLAAVVVGGVTAASDGATTATGSTVVDGDTIDVIYDDETHRVRLLNVNTPESVDPDEPVQCLGPEASQYLRDRLPVGTEVRLERDDEEVDGYGRELAAVFLADELINASIARAGLGVATSVGSNTKYLGPVRTAQEDARAASRGLYSTTVACTVPAQVAQLQTTTTETMSQAPAANAGLDEIDSFAAQLVAVAAMAKTVTRLLDGATDVFPLAAHTAAETADMRSTAQVVLAGITTGELKNDKSRAAELKRLDEVKKAAAKAARATAQVPARPSSPPRSPSSSAGSNSSGSGGSSGGSGYTGCRSYAPGGKSWTPIDC